MSSCLVWGWVFFFLARICRGSPLFRMMTFDRDFLEPGTLISLELHSSVVIGSAATAALIFADTSLFHSENSFPNKSGSPSRNYFSFETFFVFQFSSKRTNVSAIKRKKKTNPKVPRTNLNRGSGCLDGHGMVPASGPCCGLTTGVNF